MCTYTVIASIFGPILVIMGLWNLLYQENVKKVVESLRRSPADLYIIGVINLIIGLTLVNSFNTWKFSSVILVTLLGWVFLIRGLMVFFFPNAILKLSKKLEGSYMLFGLVAIIWGLFLCWIAFM